LNLNRPPRSLLPLRCWAVVAAQHPVPSYWSVLCRSPAQPGTIINTRPRCLRPRGNDRLTCYDYYQSSLAMTAPFWQRPCPYYYQCSPTMSAPSWQQPPHMLLVLSKLAPMNAPLWQRPPRVTILSSMLAQDYCALVAQTASHAKSSWPGPFTRPPVKIVRFPCCALTSRMAFTSSTSSTKQKAHLRCLRLRGKTAFSRAVLILHLSRTHNDMLRMSLSPAHFNFLVRYNYQTRASNWAQHK
jgi:hypothetical protein